MDPMAIVYAISAAKEAIDGAIQLKEKFFTKGGPQSEHETELASLPNIEALQSQLIQHEEHLAELKHQLDQCRSILEKQNEIIIELSNALKITAETTKNLKKLLTISIGISGLAMVVAVVSIFL